MKFDVAIDRFIEDMRSEGWINTDSTERSYRGTLYKHAEDVGNRDPRKVGPDDVKRTLARWSHPNTKATCRAALRSFYRWMVEERLRATNPVDQTRRPRRRPPTKPRLERDDVRRLLAAAENEREDRFLKIALYCGLRRGELRGLQGRHFQRHGFIWISADIAKRQRERWIPVPDPLAPIAEEIRQDLALDDYVFPAQRWRDPPANREKAEKRKHPSSPKALWEMVGRVGTRAGIAFGVSPHMLRHAYAEHMSRHTDVKILQQLLGHSELATTELYLGERTIDELRAAVSGFSFGLPESPGRLSLPRSLANPVEAPTGIEPV